MAQSAGSGRGFHSALRSGSSMRRPEIGVLNARRATAGPLEPVDELWLRVLSVPLALVVAALFSRSQIGHALQRMLFGMPLHELGHALTALALGIPAFPLPWFTPMRMRVLPPRAYLAPAHATGAQEALPVRTGCTPVRVLLAVPVPGARHGACLRILRGGVPV